MNQMEWQRSVIREEMYESMSTLRLGQLVQQGDTWAKQEWDRRWEQGEARDQIKNHIWDSEFGF